MKKIIFAMIALLTTTAAVAQRCVTVSARPVTGPVSASVPSVVGPSRVEGLSSMQRAIGYWPTDSITLKDVAVGQQAGTAFPVGAYLTNSMLRSYAGCKVMGVRFALGETIGRTRAFVYKVDADGGITEEPVAQNQRTYEGWNNVFFNEGKQFILDGSEELIVGFDYVETEEMIAADRGVLCTVGMEADEPDEGKLSGNEFLICGNFGSGEGWYPITNAGMLCVQLIIDVSTLPAKAIDMTYLDTGFRYKQRGESIDMLATVTNVGREAVSSYSLFYQIDDEAPQTIASTKPIGEGANESFLPTVRLSDNIAVGSHTVRVGVQTIEGTAVEPTANHVIEQRFYVFAHPLARQKVYVEHYTDQDEPIADAMNSVVELIEPDMPNACFVTVYKPGNVLAIDETKELTDLYAYTFPCFTSNRAYFPGEEYIAYDVNYYLQVVGPEFVTAIIRDVIDQDYYFASFATISMTPSYDFATRQLTVDVTGTLSEDAIPIYGDVAVTLMLTEDNVRSYQYYVNARGRKVRNNNYLHHHVLRAYLTSPQGDKVSVEGNTYSGQFVITLDDTWNEDNLSLVGIVTRYADAVTADNLKEMDVTNADALPLKDIVSGIHDIPVAEEASSVAADAPLYNLSGQRVSHHYRGIVVQKGKKYLVR